MTTGTPPPTTSSSTTSKPTLLAFHGSGSNATVHTVQLARLMRAIKPHYNVESLEAPFPSPAGPGVLPFFDGCGPFKRWLPPTEKVTIDSMRRGESTNAMAPEVEAIIVAAIKKVRSEGGKVVGLIGFSQGTKVVAGLMRTSQIRRELLRQGKDVNGVESADLFDFDLALSVCASYPPPLLPPTLNKILAASGLSDLEQKHLIEQKVQMPVFHVQGSQDEWNWAGQSLIDKHYEVADGKSEVMEWDMGHHYPVPAEESEQIRDWMLGVAGRSQGSASAR